MIDYIYDGSFEGLLTCIYLHYYVEKASGIYAKNEYQADLIRACKEISTNHTYFDKVYMAINKKISSLALQNVYYLYLSNASDKENIILSYLRMGFKRGKSVDTYHSDPLIHDVHRISRKVTAESHRFLGLIRFMDTGVFLYAVIEPDHNILVLLGDHFSNRLKNENFIIHDKKRKKALVSSKGTWHITDFKREEEFPLQEKEVFYRSLWKNYFKHIGIADRKNPRLQAQYMPRRYWKHLPEIND